jgi:hypothetical protein
MRKLFIILVGLIAVVTFIRAYDNSGRVNIETQAQNTEEISAEVFSDVSASSEAFMSSMSIVQ